MSRAVVHPERNTSPCLSDPRLIHCKRRDRALVGVRCVSVPLYFVVPLVVSVLLSSVVLSSSQSSMWKLELTVKIPSLQLFFVDTYDQFDWQYVRDNIGRQHH